MDMLVPTGTENIDDEISDTVKQVEMELNSQENGTARKIIRIVVADDHDLMRDGLAAMFEDHPGFEVVGQAKDGQEAFERAEELHPDIVLMDINMPNVNGIEATRKIRDARLNVAVIGLSMHDHEDIAEAMFDAGAIAYVQKGAPFEHLVEEITHALDKAQSENLSDDDSQN